MVKIINCSSAVVESVRMAGGEQPHHMISLIVAA